jgi:hypothetical protein
MENTTLPSMKEYFDCYERAWFDFSVCVDYQDIEVCRYNFSAETRKCLRNIEAVIDAKPLQPGSSRPEPIKPDREFSE